MAERTLPDYEIGIFWSDEDEAYSAVVPELPYCSAWGETREEALAQVQDAIRGNIEVRIDSGRPIPEPDLPSHGNETGKRGSGEVRRSDQRVIPSTRRSLHLGARTQRSAYARLLQWRYQQSEDPGRGQQGPV